ncbi:MAG: hypothetical protein WCE38_12490 [Burkholderiales bacterium]
MFDWIIDPFFALLKSIPALLTDEGSANFLLTRAMLGLLLVVLILYMIAMRPFRSAVARCMKRISSWIIRSP